MAVVRRSHRSTKDRSLDHLLNDLEMRGIDDRCVLAALSVVPREPFIALTGVVYEAARRIQALALVGDEHVLHVGVGAGYVTAVLSLLSSHVYAIDPDPELSAGARVRLSSLGYDGITLACGDAERGSAEHGPYDAILVSERMDALPPALVEQLTVGGRIVIVLRDRLVRATKRSETELVFTDLGPAPVEEGN